jgi:peptide/nickel transport system substrate-binding protein/oligopeptide transport system substrate-binding protein
VVLLALLSLAPALLVARHSEPSLPNLTERSGSGGHPVSAAHPLPARAQASGDQVLTMPAPSDFPETLDPALIRDAGSSFMARQIFRGLVSLNDEMEVVPDIAERIETTDDGHQFTFHLRTNAVFHDGSPIDAQAVKASFERATDPALADGDGFSLSAAIYLIDIEGVEDRLAGDASEIDGLRIVDDLTLEVTLTRPVANFLYKLAGTVAQIVDVESIDGDDWWLEPNGSGPFIVDDLSDDALVLTGFDDFFNGAPPLDEVRLLFGAASAEPLNLYEANRVDVTEVPFYAIDRVLSEAEPLNADLITVDQLSSTYFLINPNLEPFDDPDIRQAVMLAFEREKISSVMLDGKVRPATGIVPPGILGREWPAQFPSYDLEAAREIFARTGQPEFEPAFYDSGIAVALKQVLERDLGLRAEAISLDWPEFTARLVDQDLPAFTLSWIADYPDPANFLTSMFHSASPDNYIGYESAEMDTLLDAAEIEQDDQERERLYLAAQQLAIDDGVLIPLYYDVSYTVVKPWVKGLTVSPVGILSLDRVWIER